MTDTREEEASPCALGLASALMKKGALTTDWLPAFHAALRELFIPATIWPGTAGGNKQHNAVNRDTDRQAWLRAVYSDIPLTTQWDDGQHDGQHDGDAKGTMPTSSNSMPTMVFSMLRDLDPYEGMRVLEIGTGTGWNAALLAARLGDDQVVSVEVDQAVADTARANLAAVGRGPLVVVGDGCAGHPSGAPYDRITATCSVRGIPAAWIAQTKPGGTIVAPWGPQYGGEAIVRLIVEEDGSASGWFTRSSAFMSLRAQRVHRTPTSIYLGGKEWPADGTRTTTALSPDDVGGWLAMFAIGLQVPGVYPRPEHYRDGSYTLWLHDTAVTSWATADWEKDRTAFEVVQPGPRRLWDEVEAAWRWWDARGRPGFDRFGLTVTREGQQLVWLDHPGQPVPIPA
ncbi:protein-L-isoaspartate O-methyltransferase [Streptacidiphilus sp. BW17]|uniref:methyltransferase domain-containing protein n=1 Tax=Streptacidiphilus sp. BW17 TaxID=3156274 RepID=UPI00351100D3